MYPHGTVVQADVQTAGRGRLARTWVSKPGGLYFSVLLKPQATSFLANLTQLMALSVCRALESYMLSPTIKWPNDVQINGQKICGILSETVFDKNTLQGVIIGVGVNLAQDGLCAVGQPATSLKLCGVTADKADVLTRVLDCFWQDYPALQAHGFGALRQAYKQRFGALGKAVEIHDGDKTIFGTAEDVSQRGTLCLRNAEGLKEIYIGDLVV